MKISKTWTYKYSFHFIKYNSLSLKATIVVDGETSVGISINVRNEWQLPTLIAIIKYYILVLVNTQRKKQKINLSIKLINLSISENDIITYMKGLGGLTKKLNTNIKESY